MERDREKLYLRQADRGDMMLLYRWVNDPTVRKSAFKTKTISLEEHKAWFFSTLQKSDVKIFVLMHGKEAIGQVRLKIENRMQEIDYSIDVGMRGKGYGVRLLGLMEKVCSRNMPLVGKVKTDNIASQRVFERLGYECKRESDYYYIYRKDLLNVE